MTGQTGPTGAAGAPCLVEDANTGKLYTTLQAAVVVAESGDTLNVQGTCEGDTTINKDLTIQGQGAGATLNGENKSRSVLYVVNFQVSISGLTITGGNAPVEGGGIDVTRATLTLTNSTVSGNTSSEDAGGIYNFGSTVTLINSTVSGNKAEFGGGILSQSSNSASPATLTLKGSTVSGNTAKIYGGGIYIGSYSSAHIEAKSSITANTAGGEGGGIYTKAGTTTPTIENPEEVSGNTPENGY